MDDQFNEPEPGATVAQSVTPAESPPSDVSLHADLGKLPANRILDKLLWLWPVVVIGAMALLGQFLGSFWVLVGGVGTIGVLVLFIGAEFVPRWILMITGVLVIATVTTVFMTHGYSFLATSSTGPAAIEVKTLTGRTLTQADLLSGEGRGAVLNGVVLDHAQLPQAELDGVVAPGASLQDALLERAHLAGADLHGADLRLAHLHGADLRGANLTGANLLGADLTDACIRGAVLTGATLDGADLRGAAIQDVVVNPAARAVAKNWPATDSSACS